MATVSETYLPQLQPCLKGEILLLSWQQVYRILRVDVATTRRGVRRRDIHASVKEALQFLQDDTAMRNMASFANSFPPPTTDAKATLDSRTAPVNCPEGGPSDQYSVKNTKDCAIWLSKEAKISEVEALRIVLLEWQSRAKMRILSANAGEDGDSANDMSLGNSFQSSFLARSIPFRSSILNPDTPDDGFNTTDGLRSRLLRLYLSERSHVVRTTDLLMRHYMESRLPNWLGVQTDFVELGKLLTRTICNDDFATPQLDNCLVAFTNALSLRVNQLDSGSGWFASEGGQPDLETSWAQTQLEEMVPILQLFFCVLDRVYATPRSAEEYFRLMDRTKFLDFQLALPYTYALDLTKILAALIGAKFLQPKQPFHFAATDGNEATRIGFTMHEETILSISTVILEAASENNSLTSLPVYAWVLFVQQWSEQVPNTINVESEPISKILDSNNLRLLANRAVDEKQLFDVICRIMPQLREVFREGPDVGLENEIRTYLLWIHSYSISSGLVLYDPTIVGSLLTVLDADRSYWEPDLNRIFDTSDLAALNTNLLRPFIDLARSRFPLEAGPFVKLMKAVIISGRANGAGYSEFVKYLNNADYFTELMNMDFSAYDEADVDPSEGYYIELRGDLPIFVSNTPGAQKQSVGGPENALVPASQSDWHIVSAIDSRSVGEVLGDQSRPLVVAWQHQYKPLDYLVDWLGSAVSGSRYVSYSSFSQPSVDDICEVLSLFTTILQVLRQENTSALSADSEELARFILESRSTEFEDEKDLISIVFAIFEYQLQQYREQSGAEFQTDILAKCIDFIHAVTYVSPNRLWPYLARSQLLDLNGNDPSLVAIVTNSEMIRQQYGFLLSCIRLFERLVQLSYTQGTAARPAASTSRTALTRFGSEANGVSQARYIPSKAVRNIINGFLRIMISVFENSQFWQFSSNQEHAEVNIALMDSFDLIVETAYGFDDEPDLHKKFTAVLADSAELLTTLLLSTQNQDNLSAPLLAILSSTLPELEMATEVVNLRHLILEKHAALNLCTRLLHIATYLKTEESLLERRLFTAAPLLARLYAFADELKSPVAVLLDALLTASLRHDKTPPSLLGHMGVSSAKDFLVLVSRLRGPVRGDVGEMATWDLLSTVVSSQQQWFAMYLLTGKPPRESARREPVPAEGAPADTQAGCQSLPVLELAFKGLTHFFLVRDDRPILPTLALSVLKFITNSYNHWPSVMGTQTYHTEFLNAMITFYGDLDPIGSGGSVVWYSALAAAISEFLTLHLHRSRRIGNFEPANRLVNKLRYIKEVAFKAPNYNFSMHTQLRANVPNVYPGLTVSKFQHTLVYPVQYGENFFYDLGMAQTLFKVAKRAGRTTRLGNFMRDMAAANVDLSTVDAQVQLHHKSKLLVIELAQAQRKDPNLKLVEPLLLILKDCLTEMGDTRLPANIIGPLESSQIDLAMIILQNIISIKSTEVVIALMKMFPTVWQSISSLIMSWDDLYIGNRSALNRQLLRVLFLSLQPLTVERGNNEKGSGPNGSPLTFATFDALMDVFVNVICKGFKNLANTVHEDKESATTSDFGLLTAMLQTMLAIPDIDTLHSQMALQIAGTEVVRYGASLFSWADQLLLDGDPIYGEHAILFLLELSTINSVAETMAVEGILSQLSSANIMALYARTTAIGPFDNPPRVHSIWVRGILPLCINLLSAVGAPVAPEVLSFLAQYGNQIERNLRDLGNVSSPIGARPADSHLTLGMAAEVHSLALIAAIVDRMRGAAGNIGTSVATIGTLDKWDPQAVQSELEEWLSQRTARREFIIPANEREQEMANVNAPAGGRALTLLERKVWDELEGARRCLDEHNAS
ncbi:hypothetical protein BT63DRAFT_423912 [Microthyrium microscopicum]|uniref:Uncharacterized protein n=1 Tax=Microthyrium microscopicum TaxID=703497 RepID=A0A6A6UFS2_9PEZI|nr:hypothetical protein BT63DRAFT_423912 [Microthyrium microscopicum]